MHRVLLAVTCFGGLVIMSGFDATSVLGQDTLRPPKGPAYEFRKITEDIYTAEGTGTMNVGANTPIIIGETDVMIVDSHITPASARVLLEELKTVTDKPVRFVVNTHYHFDHAHGNQIFGSNVAIIGHEFTRFMLLNNVRDRRTYRSFTEGIPKAIADLEGQISELAPGSERENLEDQLYVQENYQAELGEVNPTPPNQTIKTMMSLYSGDREIQLHFLGRGHTGGDVIVFLPQERVICTGDLVTGGISYMGDAHVDEWIETLNKLLELDFETVLPGHGEPFTGREPIEAFRGYLTDLWDQTSRLHSEGVSAEEAAKRVDMSSHGQYYEGLDESEVDLRAIQRIFEVIEGQEIPL